MVAELYRALVYYSLVKRIDIFQPLQVLVLLEVDNRLLAGLGCMDLVFQPLHHAAQVLEVTEALELLQDLYHFGKFAEVLVCQRYIGDGILRVFVYVILLVLYNDGCVVPQLVAAHRLDIHLHGAAAHTFVYAFIFIEGIGACFHEVFERIFFVFVSQTVIERAITDQRVSVYRHAE